MPNGQGTTMNYENTNRNHVRNFLSHPLVFFTLGIPSPSILAPPFSSPLPTLLTHSLTLPDSSSPSQFKDPPSLLLHLLPRPNLATTNKTPFTPPNAFSSSVWVPPSTQSQPQENPLRPDFTLPTVFRCLALHSWSHSVKEGRKRRTHWVTFAGEQCWKSWA